MQQGSVLGSGHLQRAALKLVLHVLMLSQTVCPAAGTDAECWHSSITAEAGPCAMCLVTTSELVLTPLPAA